MDSSGWGGGGIFPPREGASRAVYGKGTDESLAPRKMKFQVLRFFLSSFPFSLSLPPPSNIVNRFGELFMPTKLPRASGK